MDDILNLEGAGEKLPVLDAYIDSFSNKQDEVIAVLHKAQELFGYLPHELQLYISRKLGLPAAHIYGVVTFYSYFNEEKRGKYTINICMGTACFVKGADKVMSEFSRILGIKTGETTADGLFTLTDVRCIGACGLAPVVMVNDKVYGHINSEDVPGLINNYKEREGLNNEPESEGPDL